MSAITLMTETADVRGLVQIETWHRPETIWEVTGRANDLLRAGVKVVLVLDPEKRMVGVFRLDEWPSRVEGDDVVTLPEVSPTFAVPARKFFE